MARILILSFVVLLSVYLTEQAYFLKEDFINKINEKATTWKAGSNFDPNIPIEDMKKLLGSFGVRSINYADTLMQKADDGNYVKFSHRIPRNFDARRKWRKCSTIGQVRDQGTCGSCWAFATSSAFADRMCVLTDGEFNQLLSPEELTFCCHLCGFGCHGGYPIQAWKFFKRHGLVTGGNYNTSEGCQPSRVQPCLIDEFGNNTCRGREPEHNHDHSCEKSCYGNSTINYEDDHRYTRDAYYLTYNTIQKDILAYGPVEASFEVYDDFFSYKSGIYEKTENATYVGGHAVKLIGWGENQGIPYWLLVNSWNENWGDKGLFKIRRGTNECGIDNSTTAGVPVIY